MGAPRPIARGDGKVYPSASAAARALVREWGFGDPTALVPNIARVANGKGVSAYGYSWRWKEGESDD